jgi:hypothetical protein
MRRSLLPPRIRAAGSAESKRLQELANYRQLPLEHGPLVMGACGGGGSGAGIRFCMAGAGGAGAPNRVVGLRPKSPRPDPWPTPAPGITPPRAKPGVDPRRQATNTDAKTRFMIAFLLLSLRACGIWSSNRETTLSLVPRFDRRCGLLLLERTGMCKPGARLRNGDRPGANE